MEDKFELKRKGYCGCHPETCCCDEFKIISGEEVVATGNNAEQMQHLVLLANYGDLTINLKETTK